MPHASLAHDWFELALGNRVWLNQIEQVASRAAIWFGWITGPADSVRYVRDVDVGSLNSLDFIAHRKQTEISDLVSTEIKKIMNAL
jgi:hypothetical protein